MGNNTLYPIIRKNLAAGNGAFAAKASAIKPIVIIKSPEYKDVPAQEKIVYGIKMIHALKNRQNRSMQKNSMVVY